MSRIAIVEVDYCGECPHEDDIGRCTLLDKGIYNDCLTSSESIREDCPLPKENEISS